MGKRLFAAAALLLLALPVLLAPWGLDMRSYRSDALTASFAEDPAGFPADRLPLRNAAITLRSRLPLTGDALFVAAMVWCWLWLGFRICRGDLRIAQVRID